MSRISVRLDQDRKEQFKQEAQSRGKSMSEAINEFIDDYLGDGGSGKLPDDGRLATCYKTIYDERSGYSVKAQDVIPVISDETNLSERNVKSLIDQLQVRGYVSVSMGFIYPNVEIPTTTPEPVTPQDRRIDRATDAVDSTDEADPITDDDEDPIQSEMDSPDRQPATDGGISNQDSRDNNNE